MRAEDFFIICLPSRSAKFDIFTAFDIGDLTGELGKTKMVAVSDAPSFQDARTGCLQKIKDGFKKYGIENSGKARVFFIDDDISIENTLAEVAEVFREAERRDLNIIGNYLAVWKNETFVNTLAIADKDGVPHHATNEQIWNLKALDPLPPGSAGGLGFYWGWANLDYKFHYDERSEDLNFYLDNKIPLHYAGLSLLHDKTLKLRVPKKPSVVESPSA